MTVSYVNHSLLAGQGEGCNQQQRKNLIFQKYFHSQFSHHRLVPNNSSRIFQCRQMQASDSEIMIEWYGSEWELSRDMTWSTFSQLQLAHTRVKVKYLRQGLNEQGPVPQVPCEMVLCGLASLLRANLTSLLALLCTSRKTV